MTNVDYSDRAVTMRVKRLSDLRHFCLMLAKTKPYSKPPSDKQAPAKRTSDV
jgi:hypothetical protein